jgi:toxin ParE1/3/4
LKLIWMPRALRELQAIHKHISRDSPANAAAMIERIISRVGQVVQFPYSGRQVPEVRFRNVREVIEPPYRVMYRIKGEAIQIVAVVHSSRTLF